MPNPSAKLAVELFISHLPTARPEALQDSGCFLGSGKVDAPLCGAGELNDGI